MDKVLTWLSLSKLLNNFSCHCRFAGHFPDAFSKQGTGFQPAERRMEY